MLTVLSVACGDDKGSGGDGGSGASGAATPNGGGGAGASSTEGGGGSTGSIGVCAEDCVPPQFCSGAGQCIDQGTCLDDADCTERGMECDERAMECVPGGGCEDLEAQIEAIPPNMLLVLDRSCSMTDDASPGVTKWQAAVAAINAMTTNYADKIRFGLSVFPDIVAPQCTQDAVVVPVAPGSEPAIQTLLTNALVTQDDYFPNGPCVTNIDTAMEQASQVVELTDPDRANFAVLLTDGKQAGCSAAGGDAGTLQIITDMFAAGIPTFVIGFGDGVDPAQLDAFAVAGGVPNASPSFYDAADQVSLEAALEAIATASISCAFTLDAVPEDPEGIFVFFDNVAVEPDPTMMNGWSYDETTNQIIFYGTDCEDLKAGTVSEVDVILSCGGPA